MAILVYLGNDLMIHFSFFLFPFVYQLIDFSAIANPWNWLSDVNFLKLYICQTCV